MVEPPSPLLSSGKARLYWLFCRLSVVELRRLLIAPLYPLAGTVRAFTACAATTPSADFCHGVRNDLSLLSLEFETGDRSPELSSTAFNAQPLDLHSVPLMDVGFAAIGQLARTLPASHPVLVHRLASLLHAFFRPHLTARPLRFAITSPPSGCEEDLHLQAVDHARHTKEGRPDLLRAALPSYKTFRFFPAPLVSCTEFFILRTELNRELRKTSYRNCHRQTAGQRTRSKPTPPDAERSRPNPFPGRRPEKHCLGRSRGPAGRSSASARLAA